MISGNMVGSYSQLGRTLTLVDENGTELVGVIVGQETIFTAGDNDVREGFIYAGDSGVSTGTKNIPAYRTDCGRIGIFPGESASLPLEQYQQYDYTELQCIISKFNTTLVNSIITDKIVVKGKLYNVNSADVIAEATKNADTKCIDLNFTNNTEDIIVIHYFTYRQEV